MSSYQTGLERPPWARATPGFLTALLATARTSFALAKSEFLLAVRTHRVVHALIAFALVIFPMVCMVVLMFLLGGADPSTAASDAVDGTGMLILPP
jgi:hypothetical protein